jgi:hypothetical protein
MLAAVSIMDLLRSLVSQQKNRYAEDGFNLDLTYITPRSIAMAFPADGWESLYRNRIDDVARLLDLKHKDKYLVFNASNRLYDESKFFNRVRSMNWPNHYPCPFEHFVTVVLEALEFLLQDPTHAVIVHCLAGKGRTGSFLNALHYATGQFATIKEANEFYLSKRGVNVSFHSQLRYMDYFVQFYDEGPLSFDFANKSIEKVEFRSKNKDFIATMNHSIRLFDFSKGEFQLAEGLFGPYYRKEDDPADSNAPWFVNECALSPWRDSHSTDILINVRVNGMLATKLFRTNFSMMAVKTDRLVFGRGDVDKVKGLPSDFQMVLFFNRFPVSKESQQRLDILNAIHAKFRETRATIETTQLRQSLFGAEAAKNPMNK